jgi:hypothetical protein
MKRFMPYIVIAVVALVVIYTVNRVSFLRTTVLGAAA